MGAKSNRMASEGEYIEYDYIWLAELAVIDRWLSYKGDYAMF